MFVCVSVLLLALLLASGAFAVRFLALIRTQEMAATRALAERTQALAGLWLSLQNYDQAVQHYVSQTAANQAAEKRRVEDLAHEIDSDFDNYPIVGDPMEAALLNELRGAISQQRGLYITIIEAPPAERKRQAESVLADRLAPAEKQIADWSQKLQAWSSQRFERADSDLAARFAGLQGSLARVLGIGAASGLILVLASMAYIVRLDRQQRARYVELAHSRQALEQLSAALVDAQETERRAISRELHDEVGQTLGALLVDIGRLSTTLAGEHPEVRAQLDGLKAAAERSFQSVRNIALLLRPSMLDDLGLAAALEWQGREVSRRSQVEVAVDSDSVPEDLPDEYAIAIYRLVQEALNNAVRHSGAKNAKVRVRSTPKSIAIEISDDGSGFDPARTRGMGILGMEERVKRLGGTLRVESEAENGATVTAELPLPAGSQAA